MRPAKTSTWLFRAVAVAAIVIGALSMRSAVAAYGAPVASVLVDPDVLVSSLAAPWWDGHLKGLRYPDRIVAVDGEELSTSDGQSSARRWDRAVERAVASGHRTVHVTVATARGRRELDLTLRPLDGLAWWLYGGGMILVASLYAGAGLIAMRVSPRGLLARTFSKAALFAALFLFTLLDYHTTRQLVPVFYVAFAMVPMAFFALPLRLPDDVPWLRGRQWIIAVLDGLGATLAAALLFAHAAGATTVAIRSICTALFGLSFFFFAGTFLLRFMRARGDRRATLHALLMSMVPIHVIIGLAFVFAALSMSASVIGFCATPALALTPMATVYALVRHDLWGSRAVLSRVLARLLIGAVACTLAVAIGAGVAAALGVAFGSALIAAGAAGVVAAVLIAVSFEVGDRSLFPSRAEYKPTIEQLSEELTGIASPEEVAAAVERTVGRWLPCESVRVDLSSAEGAPVSGFHAYDSESSGTRAIPDPDELLLPIAFRGQTLAGLRVGKKRGSALFTSDDLDLLRTISNQAALALAHANSYAELERRRREQAAAWRGEREALVETVAAEIAHEVRYPINFFRSIFKRGSNGQELDAEEIEIGCEEVERLERLVSGLRRVVTHRFERAPTSLRELAAKAEMILRDQIGARQLEIDVDADVVVRCDPDQATQVLVNLVSNALDAAGESGNVGIEWSRTPSGGALAVWDDGAGFVGDPSRVFAPWVTTKPRGTGLGLAITHRFVRAHGWTIRPDRQAGRTRFIIDVPAADVVSAASSAKVSA